MKKQLLVLAIFLLLARSAFAQSTSAAPPAVLATAPATCTVGWIFYQTNVPAGLYYCSATNVWTMIASPNILTTNNLVTVAQGGTGLGTLTAHALYVGNGTSAPTALAVCGAGSYVRGAASADPTCSTTTLPDTTATGNYLIATGTNAVAAVTPALTHANPADQTGNATATLKMNGLGAAAAPCTITPVATGRVVFTITGQLTQSTTADGVKVVMAEGTGTAPANAAAATGTLISATQTWTALTGQLTTQFSITSVKTGLALNTAVWFDLQVADVTGGTASVKNVDCTAFEQ